MRYGGMQNYGAPTGYDAPAQNNAQPTSFEPPPQQQQQRFLQQNDEENDWGNDQDVEELLPS